MSKIGEYEDDSDSSIEDHIQNVRNRRRPQVLQFDDESDEDDERVLVLRNTRRSFGLLSASESSYEEDEELPESDAEHVSSNSLSPIANSTMGSEMLSSTHEESFKNSTQYESTTEQSTVGHLKSNVKNASDFFNASAITTHERTTEDNLNSNVTDAGDSINNSTITSKEQSTVGNLKDNITDARDFINASAISTKEESSVHNSQQNVTDAGDSINISLKSISFKRTSSNNSIENSLDESVIEVYHDPDSIVQIDDSDESTEITYVPTRKSTEQSTVKPAKVEIEYDDDQEFVDASDESAEILDDSPKSSKKIQEVMQRKTHETKYVTQDVFFKEKEKLDEFRKQLGLLNQLIKTTDLDSLEDGGMKLLQRKDLLTQQCRDQGENVAHMLIIEEGTSKSQMDELGLDKIGNIVPKTFGKQALETFAAQKVVTVETLKNLHGSLNSCPTENDLAEQPSAVKVPLMRHQLRALAWLAWRERQKNPAGGILADDMGLGKTLTMISLILHDKEVGNESNLESSSDEDDDDHYWQSKKNKKLLNGGTLVICPASLLKQWEAEVERRCKRRCLDVLLHHGTKREDVRAKHLASQDMVITTYATVTRDHAHPPGNIFRIKWNRIILDEAHVIRNHKAKSCTAVCDLPARKRWVLTGTPVQNKEQDLYSLLKFLKCTPFDDLAHWRTWIVNKSAGGQERLNTILTSLLLRRTKAQLQQEGQLSSLPEKNIEVIEVELDKEEMNVYQKVLLYSQTLFADFLQQRADKSNYYTGFGTQPQKHKEIYLKTHQKMSKMFGSNNEIKQFQILVLLCRLRQICCHCSLIFSMLDENDTDESFDQMDILEKLNGLMLDDNAPEEEEDKISKNVMSKSNPVFREGRVSSKLRLALEKVKEIVESGDKVIVVSQWVSMLTRVENSLRPMGLQCIMLSGKVPVKDRTVLVDMFNARGREPKIMLLSLTAGGVGLNLVGGNHLILLDLHWNPQLESQAQDRIYRVGQTKPVRIYKFMTKDTIEEKIKALQDRKLLIADSVLTGAKYQQSSKLTIDELKNLFGVQ